MRLHLSRFGYDKCELIDDRENLSLIFPETEIKQEDMLQNKGIL